MPLKKGGFDQLYNPQALAGRHQIILAIGTHDNPNDTGALHPLLAQGRANLDAAGIDAAIGKARSTPGTPVRTTSPPPARPSCTSRSPAKPARPAAPATANSPAR